jgi:hypothetical protein
MKVTHLLLVGGATLGLMALSVDAFRGGGPEQAMPGHARAPTEANPDLGGGASINSQIARSLAQAAPSGAASAADPNALPPGGNATSLSHDFASRLGESTANVPGTDSGNLACAWAVNNVYHDVTGNWIASPDDGGNSVDGLYQAIQANPQTFTPVSQEQAVESGQDYIVLTSAMNGIGTGSHIGIGNGNAIYSNSSSSASLQQNFSPSGWDNYFQGERYYLVNAPSSSLSAN